MGFLRAAFLTLQGFLAAATGYAFTTGIRNTGNVDRSVALAGCVSFAAMLAAAWCSGLFADVTCVDIVDYRPPWRCGHHRCCRDPVWHTHKCDKVYL